MSRSDQERWAIEEDLRDLSDLDTDYDPNPDLDDDEEISAVTQESGPLIYTVGPPDGDD